MTIKLLKNLDFSISKEEFNELKRETKVFLESLKKEIKKRKIRAEIEVGGSFAKETMAKSKEYDIDVFIRFDEKYKEEELFKQLENAIKSMKIKYNKIHGSRDYIQVQKRENVSFEIIPVIKIKKAKEAKNTTDLSYFHVKYVRKKVNNKLRKEIAIAKTFFKAQKVYGAESYIQGFSGYAIECLIIYYKTFEKMIIAFSKAKEGEKIIIDPENQYKGQSIILEMNESKTHSPIILADPTWKERNVLAALSYGTFDKLKKSISLFIKHPSIDYFEIKETNINELRQQAKKGNNEFVQITLYTDRQEGDIAGTKLKKFSRFLITEISKYFEVKKEEFEYYLGRDANLYLVVKKKEDVIKQGPPLSMKDNVAAFRKANKKTYVIEGKIYAKISINKSAKEFIKNYIKANKEKIKEMDIINLEVN